MTDAAAASLASILRTVTRKIDGSHFSASRRICTISLRCAGVNSSAHAAGASRQAREANSHIVYRMRLLMRYGESDVELPLSRKASMARSLTSMARTDRTLRTNRTTSRGQARLLLACSLAVSLALAACSTVSSVTDSVFGPSTPAAAT